MSSPVKGWSEVRYWTFIRSALRKAWSKYPNKFEALKAVKRKKPVSVEGRHKFEYKCAECGCWKPLNISQGKGKKKKTLMFVDHINPAGSLKTYEDCSTFIKGLFCDLDNLQILCKSCHDVKTALERVGGDKLQLEVNKFGKEKVDKQKETLLEYGFKGTEVSNADKRKAIYRELVEGGKL